MVEMRSNWEDQSTSTPLAQSTLSKNWFDGSEVSQKVLTLQFNE
jgi:hypothetical protein